MVDSVAVVGVADVALLLALPHVIAMKNDAIASDAIPANPPISIPKHAAAKQKVATG